jgi:HAMP domain-containing protein
MLFFQTLKNFLNNNLKKQNMTLQTKIALAFIKAQTEMAKLELEKQQMELDNARKQLELQMQEMKIQADAQNQAEKTRGANTKTIVDALSKMKDMQTPYGM